MLRSYFTIALRNLWKHRLFTAINIFGLASGLTVCLLAITHIRTAFTYDTFHPNPERIYRVLTDVEDKGSNLTAFATSPMPLAPLLTRDYALAEKMTRFTRVYGDVDVNHKRLDAMSYAVDPDFFSMFGFRIRSGSPATAPNTVVLTDETAKRFFGKANPIGQTVRIGDLPPMTVTGILADDHRNSHLRFDLLMSLNGANANARKYLNDWTNYAGGYTYVRLKPNTPAITFDRILTDISASICRTTQFPYAKRYSFRSQPLTSISPAFKELAFSTYEPQIGGLSVEMAVGLVTLLLAGFNYVNLTLARSLSRAREVGIRKVSGAVRWQLIGQFMAESVVLSVLALLLAFVFLQLVTPMPFVQQWLVKGATWDLSLFSLFVSFALLAGLLAGFVPARILSSFEPAQVLRSQTGLKVIKGISLRKSLIVAQFTISLIAMIGLLTMIRQHRFMASSNYGFRTERVLSIPLGGVPYQRLANDLKTVAGVEELSPLSVMLADHGGDNHTMVRRNRSATDSVGTMSISADAGFIPAMGLHLVAGQNLPVSHRDSSGRLVLVNQEMVKALKLGDARDAVGKTIWLNDSTDVQIAGVIADFRYATMAWAIMPLLIQYEPGRFHYLNVTVAKDADTQVLADVKRIWKKLAPYESFDGQWYTDYLDQRHSHNDDIFFMSLLVGLALSIACLGLLGMVTYNTTLRIKEVGIRKVLGAKVGELVWLLSWDFVRLLLISSVIAFPLGTLLGYAFLLSFAYHVSIGIETLGGCLGLLLLIGSLTIGWRTYRVAQTNPANSLRAE
ncbi:ABC transporter permease [Arsenicibacter rosenii]|uniref:ABC transporter permease n=1 Tax=Arsenicibacter rosenii TaxID=1750698 RepID=A0A1S2VDG3_9BACT|nr:ABC transporter permease [Arsenicibacter rosenii]OIN56256.1 hypothetical protein BLX24_26020 [Arsenicibacter rosenii]